MIKILFFIDTLSGGGAEKVLQHLVNHMDQSQFDITVQTVWPDQEGKNLVPGIKYRSLYPTKNRFTKSVYRFEAAAGLTYPLHMKDNYDIECAFLEFGPTKILASSTNKKARKLAWVHCDLSHALIDYIHTSYEAFAAKTYRWYQKYDCVVCVSQTVKNSFDHIFKSAIPSKVLYNVIDDAMIRQKSEEEVPDLTKRRLTMLAVGTMYPPKNYPRLLRTHERILKSGIAHDLWILGDGVERPEIEQFIREHDLTDSVILFGFRENPFPYIKVADLIVCSSNYEGFSTVITESVILGKPVVTTDCSGMKEILGKSEYGLITENSDEAFYEGVTQLLTNTSLREHYAAKAAERGRDFSLQALVSKAEQFFKTTLETQR